MSDIWPDKIMQRAVSRLVVAARKVAFEDPDKEDLRELDAASEAFADCIPWDDEPIPPPSESASEREGYPPSWEPTDNPPTLEERVRYLELYGTKNVDSWLDNILPRIENLEKFLVVDPPSPDKRSGGELERRLRDPYSDVLNHENLQLRREAADALALCRAEVDRLERKWRSKDESWRHEYVKDIRAKDAELSSLREANQSLRERNASLEAALTKISVQDRRDTGIYKADPVPGPFATIALAALSSPLHSKSAATEEGK